MPLPPMIDVLAGHAERIAAVQRVFMDDTRQQTDYLVITGHDAAYVGARAWAKACRQLLRWPPHYHPNHQMTTTAEIRLLLNHLDNDHIDPGLRNQVLQGAQLRAGLVIGAPRKCPRSGCTGVVQPGTVKCEECSAGLDGIDGVDRCRNPLCMVPLEPGKIRRGLCDACRRHEDRHGTTRDPRNECEHRRKYIKDALTVTCATCGTELAR